ncbi:hypothetical protein GCM10011515_25250 [Tsuneonella deserti]|uniref:DUF3293 domain-containing protein n=1 Tax=Tsuneonella deserti TaxID=2035528 RepID=A0ABQ1SDW3_9SPHN|nr:DUF3293 domain-containing protein [Tsuneonella deserti]GGE04602.1 hypothetical protein GCM10011515_25250 [Tsuneonella deserti]
MARQLDASLIAAYRATDYHVFAEPPFVLRIGERSAALDDLLQRSGAAGAAFLTAWNPYSEQVPLGANMARQAELIRNLEARGWQYIPGEGRGADPAWPAEPSILLIGPSRDEAQSLARDFRQHAIVWASAGGPAELDPL